MNHFSFPQPVKKTRLALALGLFFCLATITFGQNAQIPCPELEIQMPSRALADRENFTFSLTAKDGTSLENVTVKWTVSAGTLINDNSSRTVTFTSSRDLAGQSVTITATVEDFPKGCRVIVSDTFGIQQRLPIELWDEWGKQSANEIKARIDNLFYFLTKQVPKNEGILIMYFDKNAKRSYKIDQVNKIFRAIRFRDHDATRLSFYFDTEYFGENTKVFTLPADFDYSEIGIDTSKLIKGEELTARLKTLFK